MLLLSFVRILEPSSLAGFTLAFSSAAVFLAMITPVVNRLYILESENIGLKGAREFFGFHLVLSVAAAIAAIPLCAVMGIDVLALTAFILISAICSYSIAYYTRSLEFSKVAMVYIVQGCMVMFIAVLLWCGKIGELTTAGALYLLVLAEVVVLSFALLLMRKDAVPRFRFDWKNVLSLIWRKPTRYLVIFPPIAGLNQNLDVYLLDVLSSDFELASFGSALRYGGLVGVIMGASSAILLPSVRLAVGAGQTGSLIEKHNSLGMILCGICVVMSFVGFFVIPLIDGGRYPSAPSTASVIFVAHLVLFHSSLYMALLLENRDYQFVVYGLIVLLLVLVPVRAGLILKWGGIGAAVSQLMASFIAAICWKMRYGRNSCEG